MKELFSQKLLQEFVEFDPVSKAERVYRLCRRRGKHNIAERIASRYKLKSYQDDRTISFFLALQARKKMD